MPGFEHISRGRETLAPYACQAHESRGRLFDEPSSPPERHFSATETVLFIPQPSDD